MFKTFAAATLAIGVIAGSADAQPGLPSLNCPAGMAPQATTHQGCIGVGRAQACYTYTQQTCQPVPTPVPTPPPAPGR